MFKNKNGVECFDIECPGCFGTETDNIEIVSESKKLLFSCSCGHSWSVDIVYKTRPKVNVHAQHTGNDSVELSLSIASDNDYKRLHLEIEENLFSHMKEGTVDKKYKIYRFRHQVFISQENRCGEY